MTAQTIHLLVDGEEYLLNAQDYPWFANQPEAKVRNVVQDPWGNLRWPDLDIDLELETLAHPERYPLRME